MENNEEREILVDEVENSEEQVREALALLTEKGYRIGSLAGDSGRFVDGFTEKQAMVFDYPPASFITKETWGSLGKLGVKRFSGAQPTGQFGIEFNASKKTESLEQLKNKWLEIVKLLPVASKEK